MKQRQIGDYILTEHLGNGSMGETYLAQHRFLKRPFILKILPPELASDTDFIRRFEKEVLALAKLEHPHIAKIHNASLADGVYYLIADPILSVSRQPINLGQYFIKNHHRLLEKDVLRIARQIASALDFAHEFTAHGSIKLSNILLKESEDGPDAFLTDFGLTRIIGPITALSRTYLSTATMLSSEEGISTASGLHRSFYQNFLFLAPEQRVANHPKTNPIKSDVYAFGVLLYYLLTGEFPEGYFELPSKKVPDLKWNWDLFICRALQTDPLKRPEQLEMKIEELLTLTQTASPKSQLQKLKTIAEGNKLVAPQLAVSGVTKPRPLLKPQEIARPSFDAEPGAIFQIESVVAPYRPQPQEEKAPEPLLPEMTVIPAGTYLRGSNHGGRDEMPRHAIHMNAFAIDVHPVTNEQFVLFLEAMGGEKDVNNNDIIRLKDSRINRSGGRINIESGYAKHPVVGVSWYGAVAYAKWVGKRLPTEAEWEIASYGGGENLMYPIGNQIERNDANFFSSDTTPVQSYPPNGYGLYDMAGNVYEWCQDWYDYHFYDTSVQEPNNPKGPVQGVYRILRGGCWKSSKEDLRCAHRHRNNPGVMNGTYGFRCAADVVVEE